MGYWILNLNIIFAIGCYHFSFKFNIVLICYINCSLKIDVIFICINNRILNFQSYNNKWKRFTISLFL